MTTTLLPWMENALITRKLERSRFVQNVTNLFAN